MRIRSLTAFEIPVRLRRPIRHASHERTSTQSIFIRCELDDGSVGWGEGLPRTYVTGESIDSVWRHLTETDFSSLKEKRFGNTRDAISAFGDFRLANVPADDGVETRECFGNVVRCALELALMDAGCRSENRSVGDLLYEIADAAGVATRREFVHYSGVATSVDPVKQWRTAIRLRLFGFHQVKVKVGSDGVDDSAFLRRLRTILKRSVDLRLDANEAWLPDQVVGHVTPLMPFSPSSLEQPVAHEHVDALCDIRRELSIPVMLDESLCSTADAQRAIDGRTCDLFNLRISKCGGLLNSVKLAAMASQAGLGYQLGCQVGETGILSAAGRHFATNVSDCRYVEGSYDRFLVREAYTCENMTFGYGGQGARLIGPGLGITVSEEKIRADSVRTQSLLKP